MRVYLGHKVNFLREVDGNVRISSRLWSKLKRLVWDGLEDSILGSYWDALYDRLDKP